MMTSTLFLSLCLSSVLTVSGTLTYRDGILTDLIDDCDPHDTNSCGPGKCCVKESIMYIPEAVGPKPSYRILCRPLATLGKICYLHHSTEMCPCAAGLTCKPSTFSLFGHCS